MTTKIYATQGYMVDVRSRRAGHQFVDQLAAFGDTERKQFLAQHFTVAQLQGGCELKAKGIEVEFVNEPEPVQVAEMVEVVAEVEDEAEKLFGEADVKWTASNGQQVRVWSGPTRDLYHMALDAKLYCGVRFSMVPSQQAALARKAGVVCKLGPVGLNAERKLACQRIDRGGLKSQPVG